MTGAACDRHGHGRNGQEEDTSSRESGTLVTLETICFVKTFCALKAISIPQMLVNLRMLLPLMLPHQALQYYHRTVHVRSEQS